jgi:DNA-directed RNA polymerase alpha subunit
MKDATKEELLDLFAIEILKSFISVRGQNSRDASRLAEDAYFIADKMLERREMILNQWGLDKKIVQKLNKEIEQDSINNLYLTRRSENCLKAEGIITITQLRKVTENELIKIHNLGRKSQKEIIQQMDALGYKLRDHT